MSHVVARPGWHQKLVLSIVLILGGLATESTADEAAQAADSHGTPSGAITAADYIVRVANNTAQIAADLKVVALVARAKVPVEFGTAAIVKVAGDKGEVLLEGTGQGTYALTVSGAGDHKIHIE